ncbi:MAG: hypothetical protein M3336_07925, partial [Chloroflexota bacterium]|nr:hypothetical protein [Chloroflexota bacterium]
VAHREPANGGAVRAPRREDPAAERLGWLAQGALPQYGPRVPMTNWARRTTGQVRTATSLDRQRDAE